MPTVLPPAVSWVPSYSAFLPHLNLFRLNGSILVVFGPIILSGGILPVGSCGHSLDFSQSVPFDLGMSKHPFGQKIRQLRDTRRLTMERLANMARVSPSTVIRVESDPVRTIRAGTLEEVIVALHEAAPLTEREIDELLELAEFNHAQARGIKSRLLSKALSTAADPAEERAQLMMDCISMTSRLIGLAGVHSTHKMLSNLLSGFEGPPAATETAESPPTSSTNPRAKDRGFAVPKGAIAYPVASEPGTILTMVEPTSVPVKRPRRGEKAG
jgi:transcriptional regulator with XRE-family HTH domain